MDYPADRSAFPDPELAPRAAAAPLGDSPDGCLAAVYLGVFLVLAGIVVQILVGMGYGVFAAVSVLSGASHTPGAAPPAPPTAVLVMLQVFLFGAAVAVLWGWWLVSTPDPGVTPESDASQSRLWVRVATLVQLVAVVFSTLVQLSVLSSSAGSPSFVVFLAVSIVSAVSAVAAFFAQMVYIRWLGERIPNAKVVKRARTLMWLGPVLYTVGLLLLGLGPLIALVLYWNMLEWVRKDLKRIRRERRDLLPPGAWPA